MVESKSRHDNDCVCLAQPMNHGGCELPMEGKWVQVTQVDMISGLSSGCGTCAAHQGCCKLTINVKQGIIQEALVETAGCSGATHGAAIASEILIGKTLLEALNVHLACDAINVAMREVFLNLVYGRSQTAFTENGLPIGSTLDDLAKGKIGQHGTIFSSVKTGPRYLETAEGYILAMAIDEADQPIGYRYVHTGTMLEQICNGVSPDQAFANACKEYGRCSEAEHFIDPRKQ